MYHNLLVTVAYDREHDAAPTLAVARALAGAGAQVTLIHVMEPAPVFAIDYLPEGWRDEMRAAVTNDLAALAQSLPNGHVVVAEGDPAHEVLDHAQVHGIDCIVIASHRPGMQALMLGSTAGKVVARAQCAVHVARRD